MTTSTPDSAMLSVKKLVKHTLRKFRKEAAWPTAAENPAAQTSNTLATEVMQVVPTKNNSQIVGANWLINFTSNQASEHGEDGIISKIFEILTPENKWVCEFGAHDPEIISNTWRLIAKENWQAVLIEADDGCFEKLNNYYQDSTTVHCVKSLISYTGANKLDNILAATPISADMDFMIIDIDGNDYHVWEAIEIYQAKVVMIEFNASIPSDVVYVQAQNLSLNQGSSLAAMAALGKRKGYKLIAATAWNAFFVKDAYFSLFFSAEPAVTEMYVYPAKHPIWMRAFQLYDGSITIAPWNEMLWHKINLQPADYQVLPASYRKFSPELASRDYVREKDGTKNLVAEENARYLEKIFQKPANVLARYASNQFSRYGEDGMLETLLKAIGAASGFLVDVGAGTGIIKSRSRNFARNHQWHGLMLEQDESLHTELNKFNRDLPRIKTIHAQFALEGAGSLDDLFTHHKVPTEFDILFLNTFGMEYYLWESLQAFSPHIVAVQFNPTIPNDVKFIQAADFSIHQGCSLRALVELAHYKDYELAGVTMETAIFVQRKFAYRCLEYFGMKAADLDDMFAPVAMQLFQLYDGTIELHGLDRLLWNALRIDKEKLQVVPAGLRTFHQFADPADKKFFYRVL
jgi:hypothetical protein